MLTPTPMSRGARREARRQLRNGLGTNGSDPPEARHVLRAAEWFAVLVAASTGGRFVMVLRDTSNGNDVSPQIARLIARNEES